MKLLKIALFSFTAIIFHTWACTSLMFSYKNQAIVARNFDWGEDHTELVIHPVGIQHQAAYLPQAAKPLRWHTLYGSVTFNLATAHGKLLETAVQGGMNQAGLSASLLELEPSVYATANPAYPSIDNTQLIQYWLDEFATVKEAVAALNKINVVPMIWRGEAVPVHFILYDASGDAAIVEYLKGKLTVVQGDNISYHVLTNTIYTDAIQDLKKYQDFGGTLALPGDNSSIARFVRGAVFLKHLPTPHTSLQAIGFAFAGLQETAEPPGTAYPTAWSVVYNTQTRDMYYRSLSNPNIHHLNLQQLRFDKLRLVPIE